MNITDVRVRRTYKETRLLALVSVTIDNDLAVHDIKVIQGPERIFVAMPSRRDDNGTFRDICHPITPEARGKMEEKILAAYHEYVKNHQESDTEVGVNSDFLNMIENSIRKDSVDCENYDYRATGRSESLL